MMKIKIVLLSEPLKYKIDVYNIDFIVYSITLDTFHAVQYYIKILHHVYMHKK